MQESFKSLAGASGDLSGYEQRSFHRQRQRGGPGHERGGEPAARVRDPARRGSTRSSWSTATPPTTPSRSPRPCARPPRRHADRQGQGQRPHRGLRRRHRRHHRHDRRRRLHRRPGDPRLRRPRWSPAPTSPRAPASPPAAARDDITRIRSLGNTVLTALINLLYGTRYTDLCYGYNAFWARHLDALDLDCDGFEIETLMNIRAAQAGLVDPRGPQPRAQPHPRREQPARRPRRPAGAQDHPARALPPSHDRAVEMHPKQLAA